jgi:F-type H+-transporting ATPase subunit gamma
MPNPRALDKRRKSIGNIRKITRTMELIATARFRKAMDRAIAATDYTKRITQIVSRLAEAGSDVSHPLLQPRAQVKNVRLLVLTSNRGLCGGYNSSIVRAAIARRSELAAIDGVESVKIGVSGKRGISALKFRRIPVDVSFTEFDDSPRFDQVEAIANELLKQYVLGEIDRVDVAYMRFISSARQEAVVETLLPLGSLAGPATGPGAAPSTSPSAPPAPASADRSAGGSGESIYEFVPSAESILEEIVPMSFRVRLFKCFLDGAVSEQIARMVAMKNATENAAGMIKQLSMTYNRARQARITGEIMEIIGGVEALKS